VSCQPQGGPPEFRYSIRLDLTIDPSAQTLDGPNQYKAFDDGKITFPSLAPLTVSLGEICTEDNGQLLVLSSTENSASPYNPPEPLYTYLDNKGWYDTSADGPVTAHIKLNTGEEINAVGAWVIVAPPKFAPQIDNVITLYDRIFQMGVDEEWHSGPEIPSYSQHIYPILLSAINSRWVQAKMNSDRKHDDDSPKWKQPIYDQSHREAIFSRLKDPEAIIYNNMPRLEGEATLTKTQYSNMRKWKEGNFLKDWERALQPEKSIAPTGLDRAALENCVGASFSPGIEAGGEVQKPIINPDYYLGLSDPMRLDHTKVVPGRITEFLAVPWQADFSDCRDFWWPVPRPNQVIPETESEGRYKDWDRDVFIADNPEISRLNMVDNWTKLGFVVKRGNSHIETERDPDL